MRLPAATNLNPIIPRDPVYHYVLVPGTHDCDPTQARPMPLSPSFPMTLSITLLSCCAPIHRFQTSPSFTPIIRARVRFWTGRGEISCPGPHRTWGWGMKFRPALPCNMQGPRRETGLGSTCEGPPGALQQGPAGICGATPYIWCPTRVPVFCRAPSGAPLLRVNLVPEMRISGVCQALNICWIAKDSEYSPSGACQELNMHWKCGLPAYLKLLKYAES